MMTRQQDIYDAHQCARFMRPDAARFIRPDVARFLRPGTDPADVFPALDRKYSPNQRRIPAGRSGGGRWTDEDEGGGGAMPAAATSAGAEGDLSGDVVAGDAGPFAFGDEPTRLLIDTTDWGVNDINRADDGGTTLPTIDVAWRGPQFTDIWGELYYNPNGHHEVPYDTFGKWDLLPETRKVFDGATTGKVSGSIRTHPGGIPYRNGWGREDNPHNIYNEAVRELADRFLKENDITPRQMTPDQAMELLKQVRESEDPRIRDFNRMMRLLRRLRMFRMGPRSE